MTIRFREIETCSKLLGILSNISLCLSIAEKLAHRPPIFSTFLGSQDGPWNNWKSALKCDDPFSRNLSFVPNAWFGTIGTRRSNSFFPVGRVVPSWSHCLKWDKCLSHLRQWDSLASSIWRSRLPESQLKKCNFQNFGNLMQKWHGWVMMIINDWGEAELLRIMVKNEAKPNWLFTVSHDN